jgi:endonuclease-3
LAENYKGKIKINGKELYEILSRNLMINQNDFTPTFASSLIKTPFSILISIVLSQNTTDKNAIKAFEMLYNKTKLDPRIIIRLGAEKISEIIRPAGLPKQKTRSIVSLANFIINKGEDYLLKENEMVLKQELMELPGIGEKTTDVFLSFVRHYPVFPIDTHIRRISIRWGLANKNSSYKEISNKLLEFFTPELSDKAHRLLIAFGRSYCKAKKPRCKECFLKEICPSAQI